MKAYILVIASLALSTFAYAGPSISGSPKNGPHVICAQDFKRGLWIYPVGFTNKFEGYYVADGKSKGPFDCEFTDNTESKLIWDCTASNVAQNRASAQLIINDDGKMEMQFFAKDRVENPAPADTVVCDIQ